MDYGVTAHSARMKEDRLLLFPRNAGKGKYIYSWYSANPSLQKCYIELIIQPKGAIRFSSGEKLILCKVILRQLV